MINLQLQLNLLILQKVSRLFLVRFRGLEYAYSE
jgi:hypothetical protein